MTKPLLVLAAAIAAHWLTLASVRRTEAPQLAQPLDRFPLQLGDWVSVANIPLHPDVRATIAADQFVSRRYLHSSTGEFGELFIAYFASQSPAATVDREPHLPTICLPAAGWTITGQTALPSATLLHIASGHARRDVLFWQQTPTRRFANPLLSRVYSPLDQWRTGRNDLAMIRIVLPAGASHSLLPAVDGHLQSWLAGVPFSLGGSKL
ncbi:MAG: EpsI family protein [Bryobacterales bacterium]|nr:EpsI family protein [Bryobacterales bacterium]